MPEESGLLSYQQAGAGVRDIRVGRYPALDVLYVAVRDPDWGTVPGEVLESSTVATPAGSTTVVEVRHELGDVAFRWRGTIEAEAGRLLFTMDGVAERGFAANRIGFCLLHPQALKGRPVRVSGPSGTTTGTFPVRISPDPVFSGFDRMTCCVGDGAELEIRFGGELSETEDHRNWSDPGWKTYAPPLAAARPLRLSAGQRVCRSVELRAHVTADAPRPGPAGDVVRLRIGTTIGTVPAIGLGASGQPTATPAVRDAVRSLGPSYLQVELDDSPQGKRQLSAAAAEAADLGLPLDIAIAAAPDRVAMIADQAARTVVRLGRISVFSPARHTTDSGTVDAVRAVLRQAGRTARVGGGSRAHFAGLNRGTFDAAGWDFVTYGLTPQVHHADDESILATEAALADALAQARAIAHGLPVVVGPITLRPRFNATASQPGPWPAGDDDGPDADDRQHTPLASVYLAAAAARLAGAEALTVFRTVGRRGVLTSSGRPTPAAATVSALTSLAGARLRATECADGSVVALAAAVPDGLRILTTNRSWEERRLELDGARIRAATVLTASRPAGDDPDPAWLTVPPRSVVLISAAVA